MLVYRIEDEVGEGMYYSTRTSIEELPSASERHPMPYNDSLLVENGIKAGIRSSDSHEKLNIRSNYIFGFSSIDQLRSWLYDDKWLTYLHTFGLTLNVYDVPDKDVVVGHTQAIFVRSNEVTKHSIADYFNLIVS